MIRQKDEPLVLLLAGGVGSRLNNLVQSRAKPAVPFAGIYRIIDFSLSNVMNSGFSQVGVLTQYKPLSLMRHLANGAAWDLTGRTRGVKILPPRTGSRDSDWYKGTADAVRQNIDFIRAHPSPEVIILSGDHIYSMDLDDLLQAHRRKGADMTVATMVVPKEQIHQFGTAITDSDGRVLEWEEKPAHPRTDLASMGIYVLNTDYLLNTLETYRDDTDFGMDIIPRAIAADWVYAYPFRGYWRDVGTIQAYWEANMDVLRPDSPIAPQTWGIRPNPEAEGLPYDRCPARLVGAGRVQNALVSAGCVIEGTVINSVLSPGVRVEAGAVVRDSILFHDCRVGAGAELDLVILDKRVTVGAAAVVGCGGKREKKQLNREHPKHLYSGITLVGKGAQIPAGAEIGRNCIIAPGRRAEEFNGPLASGGSL
ncbi:glucose-1-phosphate adenylyltransferase family protein [Desulfurivibrio alkaliphilus]|uniref:Nucleotidyl transferase n=1 Tax=Desulfurivibrio alkaliphilus (strain DSM 19089 / UNIQEM U267 / AHT2) TaxID=589865 RepID=D6Z3D7_DESAT|nr:glucose-1-phosphate adenylyltransferase family protein [Desulfurivibrio alkaliphilus]ADH86062.1 Nucleotidyl transferase [Desulfurivibrio alkaliphilus AHT 2]